MTRLAIALTALALAAAGVAGCGDDDEDTSSGATGATGASGAGDIAADAEAKAAARTAQVGLEVYATDQNGSYKGADVEGLAELDPTLADADLTLTTDADTYTVTATSTSGAQFSVARDSDGKVEYACSPEGSGGCPASGDWGT